METRIKRQVLRMIPHGLQVVTLRQGGEVHGYTSSWLTQVSFEPPLLALGVRADSRSRRMMEESGVFCLHFLTRDQEEMARRFFRPSQESGDKFEGLSTTVGPETGCPVLTEALAHAECRVTQVVKAGDHSIVVAEVMECAVHRDGEPLLLADTPWQYGG